MKRLVKGIEFVESALYKVFVIFSKGLFFYFSLLVGLLSKIFPLSIFDKLKSYFNRKQEDASAFLVLVMIFLVAVNFYIRFSQDNNGVASVSSSVISNRLVETETAVLDEKELNLYKRYGKLSINSVSIKELRKTNEQVVSWITVDGTNINYPIVKGTDNSYYLNHDINGNLKLSGWTFMDYRNNTDLSDENTIFYGHNLANKTSFGSLSNLFTKKWYNKSNHYIVVLNESGKHVYEIFSVYTIDPEVYYLQNSFEDKDSFYSFLKSLKKRSIYDFDVSLKNTDKIITLSTCTSDNKSRNVVHARLMKK